jgi:hypothetical protein
MENNIIEEASNKDISKYFKYIVELRTWKEKASALY